MESGVVEGPRYPLGILEPEVSVCTAPRVGNAHWNPPNEFEEFGENS